LDRRSSLRNFSGDVHCRAGDTHHAEAVGAR
jgi:hypothetical protein